VGGHLEAVKLACDRSGKGEASLVALRSPPLAGGYAVTSLHAPSMADTFTTKRAMSAGMGGATLPSMLALDGPPPLLAELAPPSPPPSTRLRLPPGPDCVPVAAPPPPPPPSPSALDTKSAAPAAAVAGVRVLDLVHRMLCSTDGEGGGHVRGAAHEQTERATRDCVAVTGELVESARPGNCTYGSRTGVPGGMVRPRCMSGFSRAFRMNGAMALMAITSASSGVDTWSAEREEGGGACKWLGLYHR